MTATRVEHELLGARFTGATVNKVLTVTERLWLGCLIATILDVGNVHHWWLKPPVHERNKTLVSCKIFHIADSFDRVGCWVLCCV